MSHEVWRIKSAYFYNAHFHGVDTESVEKRLAPYAAAIASRADLNYIFQEMLTGFSVGHLRGTGGNIPQAKHVSGGLLGADFKVHNNRYCIAKIYNGGDFNSKDKAPLSQLGLNTAAGDCILAIDGQDLPTTIDIQEPLEGTAGHAITLRVAEASGADPRDATVVLIASEYNLRNLDWIDTNQRKIDLDAALRSDRAHTERRDLRPQGDDRKRVCRFRRRCHALALSLQPYRPRWSESGPGEVLSASGTSPS